MGSNDSLAFTTNGIPNPFKTPSIDTISTNPTQISEALRILDENFYKEISEINRLFEEKHNQYLLKRHELSTRLAKTIQSMENPHGTTSSEKIQNGQSAQFINPGTTNAISSQIASYPPFPQPINSLQPIQWPGQNQVRPLNTQVGFNQMRGLASTNLFADNRFPENTVSQLSSTLEKARIQTQQLCQQHHLTNKNNTKIAPILSNAGLVRPQVNFQPQQQLQRQKELNNNERVQIIPFVNSDGSIKPINVKPQEFSKPSS